MYYYSQYYCDLYFAGQHWRRNFLEKCQRVGVNTVKNLKLQNKFEILITQSIYLYSLHFYYSIQTQPKYNFSENLGIFENYILKWPRSLTTLTPDWPRGKLDRPLPRAHNLIPKCKNEKQKSLQKFWKTNLNKHLLNF